MYRFWITPVLKLPAELPAGEADKATAKVGEELITYTSRSKNDYLTGLSVPLVSWYLQTLHLRRD